MAAEKKGQTIVIKKIIVAGAGHHGGSWKVALADFMTAMMAFFLVMWLLGQTSETKKAVSDYFSTPSLIEYSFQNFGVEITLEKLFLDFVNEPLKAFASFMEPMDKTPNIMDFGSQSTVAAFMADKLSDIIVGKKNMSIGSDKVDFDILDDKFFVPGTAIPNEQFITNMDRLKAVTQGLEDSIIDIDVRLFYQSVEGSNPDLAKKVALERLDLIRNKIQAGLEHPTVEVKGNMSVTGKKGFIDGQSQRPPGMIHFEIKQKEVKANGKKPRKLETAFGNPDDGMDVYDSFVKQLNDQKKKKPANP
ncbi:MAG: chemotaxis protein MotB [Bdellovibrionaceae bacterium]|nr:chemotaxis protein MotB [Pseudobdellovibrionaceae bacterium]